MAGKADKKSKQLEQRSRWRFDGRQKRGVASPASAYEACLELTAEEEAAIEIIAAHMFHHRLLDWKECLAGVKLADRKKKMSPALGDRYAYAIAKANDDQKALQLRNIAADRKLREKENAALEKRDAKAREWKAKHPDIVDADGKMPSKKEYSPLSYEEWVRYRRNRSVLAKYDKGVIGVTFGGKAKQKPAVRGMQSDPDDSENRKRHREWKLSRYFIKAIGDSTHACGNSVVRLDGDGMLRILVPEGIRKSVGKALGKALDKGKYLVLEKPVVFRYEWENLLASISNDKAVTSTIAYRNGAWRITSIASASVPKNVGASEAAADGGSIREEKLQSFASGKDNPAVIARNAVKQEQKAITSDTVSANIARSKIPEGDKRRFLGLDVNDGHIDVLVCDIQGNPCGKPVTLEFSNTGNTKQVKSSILHALDKVKHLCRKRHVECVFMEDLNGFLDGKSRMLNGGGRAFRRAVSRIPCGELKDWAIRKLTSSDCHVEFVPACYTSQAAAAFWSDLFSSGHQGAALMIARRGLGLGLFRRFPGSPRQSSGTGAERCPSNLGTWSPALGDGACADQDRGEPAASVADDTRDVPVSDSAILRTLRRTHRLGVPGTPRCLADFTVQGSAR